MLVDLPADHLLRKRAMDWLETQGIRHIPLFKAVSIDATADAQRFKAWLRAEAS